MTWPSTTISETQVRSAYLEKYRFLAGKDGGQLARNKKRGYNSKHYHSAFDDNQAFSQKGRSWGQNVKDAAAAALTTGALAIGAHGVVVEPLNPANGADQLGHYTSAQQEKNASESVQDGTNEAGNRSTETSQQG